MIIFVKSIVIIEFATNVEPIFRAIVLFTIEGLVKDDTPLLHDTRESFDKSIVDGNVIWTWSFESNIECIVNCKVPLPYDPTWVESMANVAPSSWPEVIPVIWTIEHFSILLTPLCEIISKAPWDSTVGGFLIFDNEKLMLWEVSDKNKFETLTVITDVLESVQVILLWTLVDIGRQVGWIVELMIWLNEVFNAFFGQ